MPTLDETVAAAVARAKQLLNGNGQTSLDQTISNAMAKAQQLLGANMPESPGITNQPFRQNPRSIPSHVANPELSNEMVGEIGQIVDRAALPVYERVKNSAREYVDTMSPSDPIMGPTYNAISGSANAAYDTIAPVITPGLQAISNVVPLPTMPGYTTASELAQQAIPAAQAVNEFGQAINEYSVQAFGHGVGGSVRYAGEALQGISKYVDSKTLEQIGKDVESMAGKEQAQSPDYAHFMNVRTPSDLVKYTVYSVSSGLGSSVPLVIGGLAGGWVGGGAVAAQRVGAFIPSYTIAVGDMMRDIQEQVPDVNEADAARLAMIGAPFYAALDMVGPVYDLTKATVIKKQILGAVLDIAIKQKWIRTSLRVAGGGLKEGIPEGLQNIVTLTTTNFAKEGSPQDLFNRIIVEGPNIANETIAGIMVGGFTELTTLPEKARTGGQQPPADQQVPAAGGNGVPQQPPTPPTGDTGTPVPQQPAPETQAPKAPVLPQPSPPTGTDEPVVPQDGMGNRVLNAELKEISTSSIDRQHEIDYDKVDGFVKAIEGGAILPPVVVVESVGNGVLVVDGHHRMEAYQKLGYDKIPAYVIPRDQFESLIESDFGGNVPSRLEDLDSYIYIDGKPYQNRPGSTDQDKPPSDAPTTPAPQGETEIPQGKAETPPPTTPALAPPAPGAEMPTEPTVPEKPAQDETEPVPIKVDTPEVQPQEPEQKKRVVPKKVQRIEEADVESATFDKPQGIYTTPSDQESPHQDLGGKKTEWDINPNAKIEIIEPYIGSEMALRRGAIDAGAGVHAVRKFLGDDIFFALKGMSKEEITRWAKANYPEGDFNTQYDKQEIIEAIGGLEGRRRGLDGFMVFDNADPRFDEVVLLTKNAIIETPTKEVTNEPEQGVSVEFVGKDGNKPLEGEPPKDVSDVGTTVGGSTESGVPSAGIEELTGKKEEEIKKFDAFTESFKPIDTMPVPAHKAFAGDGVMNEPGSAYITNGHWIVKRANLPQKQAEIVEQYNNPTRGTYAEDLLDQNFNNMEQSFDWQSQEPLTVVGHTDYKENKNDESLPTVVFVDQENNRYLADARYYRWLSRWLDFDDMYLLNPYGGEPQFVFEKDGVAVGIFLGKKDERFRKLNLENAQEVISRNVENIKPEETDDDGDGGGQVQGMPMSKLPVGSKKALEGISNIPKTLFHGTRDFIIESFIDAQGNLILKPSENFEGRTTGVSLSQDSNVAKEYSSRVVGGKGKRRAGAAIFEIDTDALPKSRLKIQSDFEIEISGKSPVVIPVGSFRIYQDFDAAETLKGAERELSLRASNLDNKTLVQKAFDTVDRKELEERENAGGELYLSHVSEDSMDLVIKYGRNPEDHFVLQELARRVRSGDVAQLYKDAIGARLPDTSKLDVNDSIVRTTKDAETAIHSLIGTDIKYDVQGTPQGMPKPKRIETMYSPPDQRTIFENDADPTVLHGGDPLLSDADLSYGDMPMRMDAPAGEINNPANRPEIIDMMEALLRTAGTNAPIRKGRFSQRALGIFKVDAEVIRLRSRQNIEVAAHEVGHALDKAMGIGDAVTQEDAGIRRRMRVELVQMGKDLYGDIQPVGGYASEGVSEFFKFYLAWDNEAQTKAPTFYKWMTETFLPENPKVEKGLSVLKERITTWREQGADLRAKQSIAPRPTLLTKAKKLTFKSVKDLIARRWVDSAHPIYLITQEAEKALGHTLRSSKNPWSIIKARRMTHVATLRFMVEHGMVDITNINVVGMSLKQALAPIKGQHEEFVRYLWARRAVALYYDPKGPRDAGISIEDAEHIVEKYEQEYPHFAQAAQNYYDWSDGLLNYMAQASPSLRILVEKIRKRDPGYYVPLMREMEELTKRYGMGVSPTASPIAKLRGSGARIKDVIESSVANASNLLLAAHRRMVIDAIIEMSKIEGFGYLVERVDKSVEVDKHSIREVFERLQKTLQDMGYDEFDMNINEMDENILNGVVSFFSLSDQPKGRDPIVPVYEGNKIVLYQVPEDLYEILMGLDVFRFKNIFLRIWASSNRVVKAGITGFSAKFGFVRNPIRDFPSMYVQSRADGIFAGKLLMNYFKSLGDSFGSRVPGKDLTEWMKIYKSLGLEMSQTLGEDSRALSHAVRKLTHNDNPLKVRTIGEAGDFLGDMLDWYRDLVQTPEATPRIAEMRTLAAQKGWEPGMPITLDDALDMQIGGKEVTTDFTAAGSFGRVWNQLVPFFNPSIQGTRTLLRRLSDPKTRAKALIRIGMTVLFGTIALWWKNKDEDWYKNMPYRDKYNYWWIRVGDQLLAIPKPFEIGVFFAAFPEMLLESWYREDPDAVKEWFGLVYENVIPNMIPHPFEVVKEQLSNWIDYFNRPIVPESLSHRPAEEQYDLYTSRAAIVLGQVLKQSPKRIDHIMRGLFGDVGSSLAITLFGMGEEGVHFWDNPKNLQEYPLINALVRRGGVYGVKSKTVDKMYAELEQRQIAVASKKTKESEENQLKRIILQNATRQVSLLLRVRQNLQNKDDRYKLATESHKIAEDVLKIMDQPLDKKALAKIRHQYNSSRREAEVQSIIVSKNRNEWNFDDLRRHVAWLDGRAAYFEDTGNLSEAKRLRSLSNKLTLKVGGRQFFDKELEKLSEEGKNLLRGYYSTSTRAYNEELKGTDEDEPEQAAPNKTGTWVKKDGKYVEVEK